MKWRALLAGVGVAGMLAACSGGDQAGGPGQAPSAPAGATSGTTAPGEATTSGATSGATITPERLDLDSVGDGITEHKLDLFLPQNQGNGPFPLVIWVHGGGWKGGDKSDIGRAEEIQIASSRVERSPVEVG